MTQKRVGKPRARWGAACLGGRAIGDVGPVGATFSAIDGVVLVHGGFHGAWCWEAVLARLEHPAIAVELPRRGERPGRGERVTIARCVDAVLEDADRAGFERFLLVGHSMGGLTITETANRVPSRISRLVYLAALTPKPAQTVAELYFAGGGGPDLSDPAGTVPLLDEPTAHAMFCGDLDDAAFAAVHARCVPEAIGLFTEGVTGYSQVPATYVRCQRDGAFPSPVADEMIPNLGPEEVVEFDSDHDAMISHPGELAALIDDIAARAQ